MKRLRLCVLWVVLTTAVPVLPACHAPVTVVTPEGKAAYTADQIAIRVNELQKAAIQAEASAALPTATTRLIVEFAVSANRTLQTTPDGWRATVTQAWAETKTHLPPTLTPLVQAALDAVDIALAAVVPAGGPQ